jgi:hypothetical protein
MAQTTGLVQRLKVTPPSILAWAYIGPTPTDTHVFLVLQNNDPTPEDAAANASMVDALSYALVSGKEVIVTHGNNDSLITVVELRA